MTLQPLGRFGAAVSIAEATWAAAIQALEGAEDVVLACHLNPDGDAVGSMLGLGLALSARWPRIVASFSGGVELPPAYRMLPGQHLLAPPGELPAAPDVLVTLDTSSRERLGEIDALVDKAGEVIVVDHHARGDDFGSICLIDQTAAATAAVVEELLRRLRQPFGTDVATCLYAGLTTDTGSFRYAATTPAVHELAARLLATGIRHDEIARRVWDTSPVGYLRLLAAALTRMRLEPADAGGLGLVWTSTSRAELVLHGLTMPEVEGVIDVIRTADTAEVAVVCKGDVDGTIKVSIRSKGRVDVGAVCARLGGGGHRFAAGYTSYDDVLPTMDRLRALLARAPHLAP